MTLAIRISRSWHDRNADAVRVRSIEEGIGEHTIAAKIDHALAHFRPLDGVPGIDIRTHGTTLYNSIYRFDDEMIVNPHAPTANSIVVAAIVRNDDGDLLMIERTDNNLWAVPGGAQDIGESVVDTVRREVREETSIDVDVTGLSGIYSDPKHVIAYDDGEVRQEFSLCFHARPIGGTLRTSSESRRVHWVRG